MHRIFTVTVALVVSAATLLVTSASAQATWTDTYPTKGYHCSGTYMAPHTRSVSTQSCVIVTNGPSGAYVQGAVHVSNLNDNPRHLVRPTGYTRLHLDGQAYRNDNCGPVTIAGGKAKWCYGKTMKIAKVRGRSRDVYSTGFVWSGAEFHDYLHSPHWKISQLPSNQSMRARIVSILRREAANPAHNHEVGRENCNFYSGALRRGSRKCRGGYLSEAWCADFGQWVWGHAGASTKYLNAGAISFKTYGTSLRTWHSGKRLAGIQIGDAVVFPHHVAFVIAVNRDHSVTTISGNSGKSSNKVGTSRYRPGQARLLGFASPVAR